MYDRKKNEEDTLERCIESVKDIVDEIIIVDTGSTDRTKEIAKTLTKEVYDFEWIDDFSAARNYSYSKATMDYILILASQAPKPLLIYKRRYRGKTFEKPTAILYFSKKMFIYFALLITVTEAPFN